MARRAHKKSRNGCLVCKQRHIRCDEQRPICSNCIVSERACEYGSRSLGATTRSGQPPPVAQVHSVSTPVSDASLRSPCVSPSDRPVDMLHIELFHNLYTQTRETFQPARSAPWLEDIVGRSITTPYLVHQLLAFSALHMSTSRPNRQEFYRYYAARLQTQALSTFKETNLAVTHETCVPLFLFATVLGIHMLCDTLIYRENGDFHAFLKRFVDFFRLYRGARTILGEAWFMIEDTPLAPSLNLGKVTFTFDGHLSGGCAKLLDLVISANLGADLTDTYRQAIESLQMCFNVAEGSDERYARINGVTVWPILLKSEFGELLEQGRPEALVILAHYAILLHRFRDSWLFGDSGVYVIVEAGKCLGSEWEEWLRWPNEVLRFS